MECGKCGVKITDGEEIKRHGQVLCEDCALDVLSPAKACDPWAVFCAKSTLKTRNEAEEISPVQKQILELLQAEGPMQRQALWERLQIEEQDLERELATLRHMEKICGELKNGARLIRLRVDD